MNTADKLLEVLSCRGRMPRAGSGGFRNAVEELSPVELERNERLWFGLYRGLIEGGFVRETIGQIEVESPVLTMLTGADARSAILIGARTKKFLDRVEQVSSEIGLDIQFQRTSTSDSFPARVLLSGDTASLQALASKMKLRWFPTPLAFILAQHHPPVVSCFNAKFGHTNLISGSKWFNPKTLKFDGMRPSGIGSFGLCRYEKYGVRNDLYRVRNESGEFESTPAVDPSIVKWALICRSSGSLAHDQAAKRVAVPRYCPLPRDLGRALALCSGLEPLDLKLSSDQSEKLGFSHEEIEVRVYQQIHPIIAHLVSEAVGCQLRATSLHDPASPNYLITA